MVRRTPPTPNMLDSLTSDVLGVNLDYVRGLTAALTHAQQKGGPNSTLCGQAHVLIDKLTRELEAAHREIETWG
jgi:hypothetical protein